MISKTEIAQFVVKAVVASKVDAVVTEQIVTHTNYNEDDRRVKLVGGAVGYVASCKTEPYTDAAVVKTIAWIKAKKDARNTK